MSDTNTRAGIPRSSMRSEIWLIDGGFEYEGMCIACGAVFINDSVLALADALADHNDDCKGPRR